MTNVSEYVSCALAVLVVVGIIVLIALSIAVPPELWAAFTLVLGFFFGRQVDPLATAARGK